MNVLWFSVSKVSKRKAEHSVAVSLMWARTEEFDWEVACATKMQQMQPHRSTMALNRNDVCE